jgi:hypothetical protein
MQNTANNKKRRTGLFFLGLFNGKPAQIFHGVNVRFGEKGPAIVLPEIKGMSRFKNLAILDRNKPAKIVQVGPEGKQKSKVFNANFRVYGGKFADPGSVLTMVEQPEGDTRVFIITDKRWDFENKLNYFEGIQVKAHSGEPDGSVAPGLMVLKDGDAIKFIHEGKTYKLTNILGEPHMIGELPVIPKKEKPVKKEVVVVADNRVKVEAPGLKVVTKVELNDRKEVVKPTPAKTEAKSPTITPVVKKDFTKKKFFKKGPSDNGNHFVPATVAVPDYVPATTGLGSVTGAEKLAAMVAEMEKGSGKKGTRKSKATVA